MVGDGVVLYQKGKGFQALPAVNMKILSECEGFHTTEGIRPSFPLAYLTCSSHFQEALGRSVQMRCGYTSHQASGDLTSSR